MNKESKTTDPIEAQGADFPGVLLETLPAQPCREAHEPNLAMTMAADRVGPDACYADYYRAMERARVAQEPPSEGGEG